MVVSGDMSPRDVVTVSIGGTPGGEFPKALA